MIENDEYFMDIALNEALTAFDEGEVPVGAVVVADGRIIARAHNLTERLNDVTAHAEMQAITMGHCIGASCHDWCTGQPICIEDILLWEGNCTLKLKLQRG